MLQQPNQADALVLEADFFSLNGEIIPSKNSVVSTPPRTLSRGPLSPHLRRGIAKLLSNFIGTVKAGGIVNESKSLRDFISKILENERNSAEIPASEGMTPREKLFVAKRDDSIQLCRQIMLKNKVRHIPVVDDEDIVLWGCQYDGDYQST